MVCLLRGVAEVPNEVIVSRISRLHRERPIRDQVIPVLVLLQSTESHLGSWNILLGVLQVLELEGRVVSTCLGVGYFMETAAVAENIPEYSHPM
jgi:hypothetical protein